jgi:hypothetical protein
MLSQVGSWSLAQRFLFPRESGRRRQDFACWSYGLYTEIEAWMLMALLKSLFEGLQPKLDGDTTWSCFSKDHRSSLGRYLGILSWDVRDDCSREVCKQGDSWSQAYEWVKEGLSQPEIDLPHHFKPFLQIELQASRLEQPFTIQEWTRLFHHHLDCNSSLSSYLFTSAP